ncbi:amino acid ABC transporter ATP-binding protein [Quadrisphaera sp. INWT6]|uniref:amino acid ABC transporter ATP-binding protein n=1 Tax=Quadrisphaera sp. INWT6 TaxID=2596917 RepID=UPI001891FFA3|nr:amino acid ABC transporter ATP-binding protein [Quadrisphaera sp. INWT6]MBF5080665.1 amino acid ABC transporter ATP-binding protein [Quadrisphaera sp. INWT6]
MTDPTPAVEQPVLRVRNLVKSYGDVPVLRGVDLDVDEHRVVTLIGASGSGKSTLLRCVDLLEQVDDGQVWLDGQDVTDPRVDADAVRRRIGVVFQAYNLFPHLSVLDNITLAPRRVHGVDRAEAEERAVALLDRIGLAGRARAYPDQLSGGQAQRTAIVRALAVQPRLLLLDEVTSALDPELVGEVLALVREVAEGGMTILMATHEMGFARSAADVVCFLEGGVLLEQGPPEQVLVDPQHERTRQFLRRVVAAGRL